MTKSEQIKSDMAKYKEAIHLNNFSISEDIAREYKLFGLPPHMVLQELNEILADSELIEHRDNGYFELAKEI